jgi:hypothetical protein
MKQRAGGSSTTRMSDTTSRGAPIDSANNKVNL